MSMPPQVRALCERYAALGALLPRPGDATDDALEDERGRAGIKLVLAEMRLTLAQIQAAARAEMTKAS
jgi:hypothetical protein